MSACVVWFRKSLRLHDNPALTAACQEKGISSIIPLYVLDPNILGQDFEKFGPNRLSFLFRKPARLGFSTLVRVRKQAHHSQRRSCAGPRMPCSKTRSKLGFPLLRIRLGTLRTGNLFFDRANPPQKQSGFEDQNIRCLPDRFGLGRNNCFARLPQPKVDEGHAEIVFLELGYRGKWFLPSRRSTPHPRQLKPLPPCRFFSSSGPANPLRSYSSDKLSDLLPISLKTEILSRNSYFPGGETEALARLQKKVSGQVDFVNSFRKPKTASTNEPDEPLEPSTTGLSPYLSTGCLSVRMLWKECEKCYLSGNHSQPPESLHGQLLFREMFYLLSRSVENWDQDSGNEMCKPIDWDEFQAEKMNAWEKGQTGFPLIDAMMRQLDATGWIHHLGRHAVSCFLTRGQLWQNWRFGRDVFDKKLVDSDWALNNGNWLWLSGVAPFSMPYFRLYNPCPDAKSSLNAETKTARFIKFWVPELKHLPSKYAYEPHLAPPSVQKESNCIIGQDYPFPLVDRKQSAKENLAKFKDSLGRIGSSGS